MGIPTPVGILCAFPCLLADGAVFQSHPGSQRALHTYAGTDEDHRQDPASNGGQGAFLFVRVFPAQDLCWRGEPVSEKTRHVFGVTTSGQITSRGKQSLARSRSRCLVMLPLGEAGVPCKHASSRQLVSVLCCLIVIHILQ